MILGMVLMVQSLLGWMVYDPQGNIVDTSASQTQGLQEAVNLAVQLGVNLEVRGGGHVSNRDPSRITLQVPLHIPPSAKVGFTFKSVSLWFPNATTDDGVVIDSFDMLYFHFTGQIIYPGSSAAVKIRPAGTFFEGDDPFRCATSSRIYIQTIALVNAVTMFPQKQRGIGVIVDPVAPVTFNSIEVDEVNGGTRGFWVAPKSQGGYFNTKQNKVVINFWH